MQIPIYINLETNSVKATPINILQYSVGVQLKFIPYTVESEQENKYHCTINGEPVTSCEPEVEEPVLQERFNLISISVDMADGTKFVDMTTTDIYEIPVQLLSVTGDIDMTLEFYKDEELLLQHKLTLIHVIENYENPNPITINNDYPILKKLIIEVQKSRRESREEIAAYKKLIDDKLIEIEQKHQAIIADTYTRDEIDNKFLILKTNNKLV